MVNFTRRSLNGLILVFAFSVLTAFVNYFFRITLARNMSIKEYGLFYAVFSFVAFINSFRDLGLKTAVVKFIPVLYFKKKFSKLKSLIIFFLVIQIIFATIISFFMIVLSNYLAIHYFHDPQSAMLVRFISIFFIIDSFLVTLASSFRGFNRMGYRASLDFFNSTFILLATLLFIKLGYGILSPAVAYLFGGIFICMIYVPILISKIFPAFKNAKIVKDLPLFKSAIVFGSHMILAGMGWYIMRYMDTIILTLSSNIEDVGIYNVALPTVSVLIFLSTSITQVLLPTISELWAKNLRDHVIEGIRLVYQYSFVIMIPSVFIFVLFSDLVIKTLFGSSYLKAAPILIILSFGAIFTMFSEINFAVISGIGRTIFISRTILIATVFNIILNLALVPYFGAIGVSINNLVTYTIVASISYFYMQKLIDFKVPWLSFGKTLAASIIFVFLVKYLKYYFAFSNLLLECLIVILISGSAYLLLIFLFKVIELHEIRRIIKRYFSKV